MRRREGGALSLFASIRDTGGIGYIHYQLGHVRRAQGDLSGAKARLLEAVRHLGTVGERPTMALVLETLAGVELDGGRAEQAARLLGGAESLRE